MLPSLAGIPLTAGFVGKFYLLAARKGSTLWLLVILAVLASAVGLFFICVLSSLCTRRCHGG